jgi:hypothetical protein
MPSKLPKQLFKIATAVLPPATDVRITALEMGGGRQPSTESPLESMGDSMPMFMKNLAEVIKIRGHTAK